MGNAVYYTKIFFNNKEEASIEFSKIKEFFLEGSNAYEFWQENRSKENYQEKFWQEFYYLFPIITKYLEENNLFGEDYNNSLAGELDFGSIDEIEQNMVQKEDIIQYCADVWHGATWNKIANFITKKYKVKKVKWITDEDIPNLDPFDIQKLWSD
jgi:hypothetical protein